MLSGLDPEPNDTIADADVLWSQVELDADPALVYDFPPYSSVPLDFHGELAPGDVDVGAPGSSSCRRVAMCS